MIQILFNFGGEWKFKDDNVYYCCNEANSEWYGISIDKSDFNVEDVKNEIDGGNQDVEYNQWKGKQVALKNIYGDPGESYSTLPAYLYMVRQVNKDSITHLLTDSEGRFKYMFLAYGACIDGFSRMRKVISIDGTFLKSKYRGSLLVATAQDGNFHQYPIAWGIVDSENDESWTWFLSKLRDVIPDDPELVIVSDRHISITHAIQNCYIHASHVHCVWHISQNLKRRAIGDRGIKSFMSTAYMYRESDFEESYSRLKDEHPRVTAHLEKYSRRINGLEHVLPDTDII